MALISKTRDQVAVPHEPGEWFTFRPLSGPEIEEAREVKVKRAMETARQMMEGMDAEVITAAMAGRERTATQPIDQYDHPTLLRYAVAAWSYSDTVDVTDLDGRTSRWAVGVILDRNGLNETEADRKNG